MIKENKGSFINFTDNDEIKITIPEYQYKLLTEAPLRLLREFSQELTVMIDKELDNCEMRQHCYHHDDIIEVLLRKYEPILK